MYELADMARELRIYRCFWTEFNSFNTEDQCALKRMEGLPLRGWLICEP